MGSSTRARGGARPRNRKKVRLRPGRALVALGVVVGAAYLAWHPAATWFATHGEVSARRAEVEALREEKARLDAELATTLSVEALARDARAIGQTRPGEQLFIVKGVDAWRAAHPD